MLSSSQLLNLPSDMLMNEILPQLSANELLMFGKSHSLLNGYAKNVLLQNNKLSPNQWRKLLHIWTLEPERKWLNDDAIQHKINRMPPDIFLTVALQLFQLSRQGMSLEITDRLIDHSSSFPCEPQTENNISEMLAVLMSCLSDAQRKKTWGNPKRRNHRALFDALTWHLSDELVDTYLASNEWLGSLHMPMYRLSSDQIETVFQALLRYFKDDGLLTIERESMWPQLSHILNYFNAEQLNKMGDWADQRALLGQLDDAIAISQLFRIIRPGVSCLYVSKLYAPFFEYVSKNKLSLVNYDVWGRLNNPRSVLYYELYKANTYFTTEQQALVGEAFFGLYLREIQKDSCYPFYTDLPMNFIDSMSVDLKKKIASNFRATLDANDDITGSFMAGVEELYASLEVAIGDKKSIEAEYIRIKKLSVNQRWVWDDFFTKAAPYLRDKADDIFELLCDFSRELADNKQQVARHYIPYISTEMVIKLLTIKNAWTRYHKLLVECLYERLDDIDSAIIAPHMLPLAKYRYVNLSEKPLLSMVEGIIIKFSSRPDVQLSDEVINSLCDTLQDSNSYYFLLTRNVWQHLKSLGRYDLPPLNFSDEKPQGLNEMLRLSDFLKNQDSTNVSQIGFFKVVNKAEGYVQETGTNPTHVSSLSSCAKSMHGMT